MCRPQECCTDVVVSLALPIVIVAGMEHPLEYHFRSKENIFLVPKTLSYESILISYLYPLSGLY